MSQPDAGIILLMMGVCLLFAGGVFGWLALRATRPIRHRRRAIRHARRELKREEKRRKRDMRLQVKTGNVTSVAAKKRTTPRPSRDWGKEAERKFGTRDVDPDDTGAHFAIKDDGDDTGEMAPIGNDQGAAATA